MSAGYETLYETPYETHNVQQANPSAHKTCMKQGRETRGFVRGSTLARADRSSPLRPPRPSACPTNPMAMQATSAVGRSFGLGRDRCGSMRHSTRLVSPSPDLNEPDPALKVGPPAPINRSGWQWVSPPASCWPHPSLTPPDRLTLPRCMLPHRGPIDSIQVALQTGCDPTLPELRPPAPLEPRWCGRAGWVGSGWACLSGACMAG